MMTGASQVQQKERERESERSSSGKPRQRGPFRLQFYDKILRIHLTENSEFIGRNLEMSRQNVRNVLKAKIKFK